jgi:heterodisulfide reductase subunit C
MDYNPTQVVRLVEFGQRERVLESRAIWLCVGCYACVSQCPNRVHIPAMMDTLREMALESGVRVSEAGISTFHREFLEEVRRRGRVYELGLAVRYKLATRSWFHDMLAGIRLVAKGRFHFLPARVRGWKRVRRFLGGENGRG